MADGYREIPEDIDRMPSGIPFIIGNEFAERYSFYGMKAILFTFMTEYLLGGDGQPSPMAEQEATGYFHFFTAAVYATPFFGAILSDALFGKYRTIVTISVLYCLGHLALSLDETRLGLTVGLTLIALGAGGIKPCVSAHVGDQFGRKNQHLLERVFSWFYFSINFGAFTSMILAPIMLHEVGPSLAFGVPGVLMVVATWCFWLGRRRFAHIPPAGRAFARDVLSVDGLKVVGKLLPLVVFFAMFWALFDQTGSTWVAQGKRLNTEVFGVILYAEQLQAANPLLVMAFIPLFSYLVYPALDRVFGLSPLRKISIGFFVMVPAFLIPAYIEAELGAGRQPSILWQIPAYIVLTASEIMVSVTGLEFFYTQAPNRLKSFVMSLFLGAVALGNAFTSGVNFFLKNPDGTPALQGASYYLLFAGLMLVTAVLFVFYAMVYREQRFVQGAVDIAPGEAVGDAVSAQ
ncbi:MAG: POT family MFS transporter [Myxococcales bacterium]|nr:POT family MFS transporter [Myxococcales bacterium]